jgi:hypothetical protein
MVHAHLLEAVQGRCYMRRAGAHLPCGDGIRLEPVRRLVVSVVPVETDLQGKGGVGVGRR